VRQVGYLQRVYRDAQSTGHKKTTAFPVNTNNTDQYINITNKNCLTDKL